MKILVVDDDALVLKSLQMILKAEGVEEIYTSKTVKRPLISIMTIRLI